MLTKTERRSFADALLTAELNHSPIEPLTKTHPEATVEDAYRIALLVTEAKVASGRMVKGHKIGLTSKVMREMAGADEPDYGAMFDNWFVAEGSPVSLSDLNRPSVEAELAFVLGERLGGPAATVADVIRATDFVLPALEIVDSRYTGRGPGKTVIDSIADAAWCGRVVLGGNPRRLADIDIRRIGGALSINGDIQQTGVASAVMGNPVTAVAWLVNKLHEFGVQLEPGQVVMSGSFVRAVPLSAGDTVAALFDEFGDVGFTVCD